MDDISRIFRKGFAVPIEDQIILAILCGAFVAFGLALAYGSAVAGGSRKD